MARALQLARAVEGRPSPNPPVGAVLVGHGVDVTVGERSDEAAELIAAHARYSVFGTPLVTLFQSGPAAVLLRLVDTTDVVLAIAGPLQPSASRAIRTAGRTPHRQEVRVG